MTKDNTFVSLYSYTLKLIADLERKAKQYENSHSLESEQLIDDSIPVADRRGLCHES